MNPASWAYIGTLCVILALVALAFGVGGRR